MIKSFLHFLYKRYQKEFDIFSIEETVGKIPVSITPPSADMFPRFGKKFEQFLLHEAYLVHRKMMENPKNGDYYDGWIGHIRFLHKLCVRYTPQEEEKPKPKQEKKENPLIGVQDFIRGMNKLKK